MALYDWNRDGNKECVAKSYPTFFEDMELLKAGGRACPVSGYRKRFLVR